MTNYLSTVVRIETQYTDFDWLNPYKTKAEGTAIGTGTFISNKGHILTCFHVVAGAVKIWITIPSIGKEKMEAKIVSAFPYADIALLKVDNYESEFIKLGNSDKIEQGETVTVIGYPLGSPTLKISSGVVSGIDGNMIQTDSPINSGNSGGPLINAAGLLIGINTSKIVSVGVESIGYATQINTFKVVQDEMMKGTILIRQPELGVEFNNLSSFMAEYYGITDNKSCNTGYHIVHVVKNSPMYNAGVKKGDILCSFDKYKVDNFGECYVDWSDEKIHIEDLWYRYKIGDEIPISFWTTNDEQNKFIKNATLKLTDLTTFYKLIRVQPEFEKVDYEIIGGLVLMNLTINHVYLFNKSTNMPLNQLCNLSSYLNPSKRNTSAIIVTAVLAGSYFKKTEAIMQGDIIRKVNGAKVSNLEEFREAIKKLVVKGKKKFITITTKRDTVEAIDIQTLLTDEEFLIGHFKYHPSITYEHFKTLKKEKAEKKKQKK